MTGKQLVKCLFNNKLNRIRYTGTTIILILSFTMAGAQYISEVLEYMPAPGQFINSAPWGLPSSASSIVGTVNGSLCLGSFGGYVIFRFKNPVENHPDNPYGVDFTIFGNPLADWSEPGIVWIMEDDNENGFPDDTWYELNGSDCYFSSSVRNYEVTFTNPGDTAAMDVPWIDNAGNYGTVQANSIHTQPYFPDRDSFPSIPEHEYTLTGSSIEAVVNVTDGPGIKSIRRAFGYADNQLRGVPPYTKPDNPYTEEIENSGGDAFDIDWAVDSVGEYVDLDKIHFVKVQNAVQTYGGLLGELSTEVTGAVDVANDGSISGERDMIVIRDLPVEIEATTFQLEAFVFHGGRLQTNRTVLWTSNKADATVDEDQMLKVNEPGPLVLTGSLTDRPEISATVSTTIKIDYTTLEAGMETSPHIKLFPNPAYNYTRISGVRAAAVSLYDAVGKCSLSFENYYEGDPIDLTGLQGGLYMVKIDHGERVVWMKLLKE